MTKTVTIPMSKESCHKIKYGIGLTVGFGLPIMMITLMVIVIIDLWNWHSNFDRAHVIVGSGVVTIVTLILTLKILHDDNHWINFKCNCEKDD